MVSIAKVTKCEPVEAEEKLLVPKQWIAKVEEKAAWSKEIASKAMDNYMVSIKFKPEITKCTTNSFIKGFKDCLAQVEKLFPNAKLSSLNIGDNKGKR